MTTFENIFIMWFVTVLISCVFGIIFSYRAEKRYAEVHSKYLYFLALMHFVVVIPVVNMLVIGYFAIFLFDHINYYKQYIDKNADDTAADVIAETDNKVQELENDNKKLIQKAIKKIKAQREELYKCDFMEDYYYRVKDSEWKQIENISHKGDVYFLRGMTFKVAVTDESVIVSSVDYCMENVADTYNRDNLICVEEAVIRSYLRIGDNSYSYLE